MLLKIRGNLLKATMFLKTIRLAAAAEWTCTPCDRGLIWAAKHAALAIDEFQESFPKTEAYSNPVILILILRSVAAKNLLLESLRKKQILRCAQDDRMVGLRAKQMLLPFCGISMTRTGLGMTGNAAPGDPEDGSK